MSAGNIRKFAILFFAAISFCMAAFYFVNAFRFIPGYDFNLRYNEVECLRKGIDPYDIVTKSVPSDEYALFDTPGAVAEGKKVLHVYTPWEYTWFMPLSFLSEHAAGIVFLLISAASFALVSVFAGIEGKKAGKDWLDVVFVMSAALFIGYAGGEVLEVGNYGTINALCIVLLITALSTGHDILAGFAWAVLMTKPQIGTLFAIPILMKRRFITAGVAAALCMISAIPPTLICGRNPLEMILEVPRGCSFVAEGNGTMLVPSKIYVMLNGKMPFALLSGISMFLGAAICLVLTWRLRKTKNWFVFFAPAIICALIWNYCKTHDRTILCVTQFLLAIAAIQTKKKAVRYYCLILILLTACPLSPYFNYNPVIKLTRRISLIMLIFGCWMIPRLNLFDSEKERET